MSSHLSIKNLNKSFEHLQVLENINLSVNKAEFVTIIGPSGCGKSTLFNIIAGIENQTKGNIKIDDEEIIKRTGLFGYMLQNPLLLPWRTVEENLVLGLDVKQEPRKKSILSARKLLEEFSLGEFSKHYPYTLSGGMKQRIALLRTILFHKDFLLLDEPFGSLDSITRLECQKWLLTVCKEFHPSILLITHDIREALLLSDRIYVMSKRPGKIIKEIKDVKKRNTGPLEKELIKLLL